MSDFARGVFLPRVKQTKQMLNLALVILFVSLTACGSARAKITNLEPIPLLDLQTPNSSVTFTVRIKVPRDGDLFDLGIAVPTTHKGAGMAADYEVLINNSSMRLDAYVTEVKSGENVALLESVNNGVSQEDIKPPTKLVNPGLLQMIFHSSAVFKGKKISMDHLAIANLPITKSGEYRIKLVNRTQQNPYFDDVLPFFELQHLGK